MIKLLVILIAILAFCCVVIATLPDPPNGYYGTRDDIQFWRLGKEKEWDGE